MSFIYTATGNFINKTVESFNNTIENLENIDNETSSPKKCWTIIPDGCSKKLSETDKPTDWFIDPYANELTCKHERKNAFNNYCKNKSTKQVWSNSSPKTTVMPNSSPKTTVMPKMKNQDFLALDGNLVLNGVIKATNFIKADGSQLKEVPILKNNYIIPKQITINGDTVRIDKVNTNELKVNGHIMGNMPDTRNVNLMPKQYRSKIKKGEIKEFKKSSAIGVNISGVTFGILTTTVPWPDTSGGNVFQNFEASYGGVRHIAKRNESNDSSWTKWVYIDSGFKNDGMTSSVKNYGHYQPFRYFKRNGIVHVQGLVKPNNSWGKIATLPEGFRPKKRLIFNLNNNSKTARVDVMTDGVIGWVAGGKDHNWISLDGISFPVEN